MCHSEIEVKCNIISHLHALVSMATVRSLTKYINSWSLKNNHHVPSVLHKKGLIQVGPTLSMYSNFAIKRFFFSTFPKQLHKISQMHCHNHINVIRLIKCHTVIKLNTERFFCHRRAAGIHHSELKPLDY